MRRTRESKGMRLYKCSTSLSDSRSLSTTLVIHLKTEDPCRSSGASSPSSLPPKERKHSVRPMSGSPNSLNLLRRGLELLFHLHLAFPLAPEGVIRYGVKGAAAPRTPRGGKSDLHSTLLHDAKAPPMAGAALQSWRFRAMHVVVEGVCVDFPGTWVLNAVQAGRQGDG